MDVDGKFLFGIVSAVISGMSYVAAYCVSRSDKMVRESDTVVSKETKQVASLAISLMTCSALMMSCVHSAKNESTTALNFDTLFA